MSTAIDRAHLARYTAGDDALEREILHLFVEQAQMWSRLLDPAAADDQWYDAAHTLKGSASGVGAWAVADICERMEDLVGGDLAAERARALEDLQNALRAAMGRAREIVDGV